MKTNISQKFAVFLALLIGLAHGLRMPPSLSTVARAAKRGLRTFPKTNTPVPHTVLKRNVGAGAANEGSPVTLEHYGGLILGAMWITGVVLHAKYYGDAVRGFPPMSSRPLTAQEKERKS